MGRHHTTDKMTKEQALAIMAYDIADLIDKDDRYDGLIPKNKLTQDDLIKLLPDLFRAAGFDPFKTASPEPATAEQAVEPVVAEPAMDLVHTCNNGDGPYFGRLKPDECARCAERERERAAGIPARRAPARVQASQHRREQDEISRLHLDAHLSSPTHRNGTCNGVLPCTYGQW